MASSTAVARYIGIPEDNITLLAGIHVLVIDDDERSRRFLRAALEAGGALVTATPSAEAAGAALMADVVVCDLATAEAAGSGFLERLAARHTPHGYRVPSIALRSPGVRVATHRPVPHFDRYLVKPVGGDELRIVVWELIRQ